MLDQFDIKLLNALQDDASLTNAALSGRVNLSPSQCSRRRAALEEAGIIRGYRACLDARKLGIAIEAMVRVSLIAHGENTADEFAAFLDRLDSVQEAYAITGDADYILVVRARSLDDLAEIIHRRLLPHPQVNQVRSDIVLKTVKPDRGLALR